MVKITALVFDGDGNNPNVIDLTFEDMYILVGSNVRNQAKKLVSKTDEDLDLSVCRLS